MKTDSQIIDDLGGNQAVADLCSPTKAAVVSGWRKRGIPRPWRVFLKTTRPEIFEGDGDDVVPPKNERRTGGDRRST